MPLGGRVSEATPASVTWSWTHRSFPRETQHHAEVHDAQRALQPGARTRPHRGLGLSRGSAVPAASRSGALSGQQLLRCAVCDITRGSLIMGAPPPLVLNCGSPVLTFCGIPCWWTELSTRPWTVVRRAKSTHGSHASSLDNQALALPGWLQRVNVTWSAPPGLGDGAVSRARTWCWWLIGWTFGTGSS